MKGTTETATYPITPGSSLTDPANAFYIARKRPFDVVSKQHRFQEFHLGTQVENGNILGAMISVFTLRYATFSLLIADTDWDNIEGHYEWRPRPEHDATMQPFPPFFISGGSVYHVDFEAYEESIKAFNAPVTLITRFFFDGAAPAAAMTDF